MLLHDFDLARFLMKDEVEWVFADETNLVVDSEGIERFADNVTVSLHFKNEALGTAHASMHAGYGYGYPDRVHEQEHGLFNCRFSYFSVLSFLYIEYKKMYHLFSFQQRLFFMNSLF